MIAREQAVERALSCVDKPITYKLGRGGFKPDAPSPGKLCDCSGFTSWCLGFSRWQKDHPWYGPHNGGWVNTDSMVADAHEEAFGLFDLVDYSQEPTQPGDLLVYGRGSGRRYGHVGIVVETEGWSPSVVVDCSAGHPLGRSVQKRNADHWLQRGGIVVTPVQFGDDEDLADGLSAELQAMSDRLAALAVDARRRRA